MEAGVQCRTRGGGRREREEREGGHRDGKADRIRRKEGKEKERDKEEK